VEQKFTSLLKARFELPTPISPLSFNSLA